MWCKINLAKIKLCLFVCLFVIVNKVKSNPIHSDTSGKNLGQIEVDLMKEYLNPEAKPCEDFFEYSCGNWEHFNPMPVYDAKHNNFEKLIQQNFVKINDILSEKLDANEDDSQTAEMKAKNLYQSCMNTSLRKSKGIIPLIDFLDEFGGWPILNSNWSETDFDWLTVTAKLRLYQLNYFITSGIIPDLMNSSRNIFTFAPSLFQGKQNYRNNSEQLAALKRYTKNTLKIFGIGTKDSQEYTNEMIEFSRNLLELMPNTLNVDDLQTSYKYFTLKDLKESLPEFDWRRYLQILYDDIPFDDELELAVVDLEYFRNLSRLMDQTPSRIIANYLIFGIVTTAQKYVDDSFDVENINLVRSLTGNDDQDHPPLWMICVAAVNDALGMVVSSLFVRRYFDEESKYDVRNMTKLIQDTFREMLIKNTWLDESTKETALEKLENLGLQVGYPDLIRDEDFLNEIFSEVTIHPDKYFQNIVNLVRFEAKMSLLPVDTAVSRNQWATLPHDVNAFYKQPTNEILIPAGILQPPFYHKDFPGFLKFGRIGSLIAHEMIHGFDSNGREFDADGNLRNWWTNESIAVFNSKVDCLVSQYSNYTFGNSSVSGKKSKAENIADNGGIRIAFKAYKKWLDENTAEMETVSWSEFSSEKLFFVGHAQTWCSVVEPKSTQFFTQIDFHSPENYRVIGPLSNSEHFSREFSCQLGDSMNPELKCKVW